MAASTNFPGLSRSMPGYERPVPDDAVAVAAPTPRNLSGAAAIGGEPTSTVISRAHKQIEDALTEFEKDGWNDISAAEQRGELTPTGRAEMSHDASTGPSAAVDAAVAHAAHRAELADRDYETARNALVAKPSDVVTALRHNQWWSRTIRELDGIPAEKLVGTAQRLIETADGPGLGWASVELPSYLRSRNVDDGWVNSALEKVSPKLKTAAAQRKLATQAHAIISSNARAAKRAMQSAGNGSYRRPRSVDVSAFDPDA